MKDQSQPATKGDVQQLELRIDKKLDSLERRVDTKLESLREEMISMKDQIIRAFRMTEENIRQDAAHVDEVATLDQRVTRLEEHVGLEAS